MKWLKLRLRKWLGIEALAERVVTIELGRLGIEEPWIIDPSNSTVHSIDKDGKYYLVKGYDKP